MFLSDMLTLFLIYCNFGNGLGTRIFRQDYSYLDNFKSFYKYHMVATTWSRAKSECEREGAKLFYPNDEEEVKLLLNGFESFYIGVADWIVKDAFETIDAKPLTAIYNKWAYGEPNNDGNNGGCVILREDNTLSDVNCKQMYPFICKKTLSSVRWAQDCGIPYPEYKYSKKLGSCYKFHLMPRNWTDAFAICNAELSHLAVINSNVEAQHLVRITADAPKHGIKGDYLRGAVHLGFNNTDGWIGMTGSGYNQWSYSNPVDGGNDMGCGAMLYNGQLVHIGCNEKMFFICEHEV